MRKWMVGAGWVVLAGSVAAACGSQESGPSGFVPAAEHLWAEVLYVTGRLYLDERTSLLTSLDEALCYAAGLASD